MNEKNVLSPQDSPKKNQISSIPDLNPDSSPYHPRNRHVNPKSAIAMYFTPLHTYLNRKYSENNSINYHSSNFIRKELLRPNDSFSNEEEQENSNDNDEYNQLASGGNYQHQKMEYVNNNQNNMGIPPQMMGYDMRQFPMMGMGRPRFNSTNFMDGGFMNLSLFNNTSTFSNANTGGEKFGRKGWTCGVCGNFNYDTRNKCNRCGKSKSPTKIKKKNSDALGSTTNNTRKSSYNGEHPKKKNSGNNVNGSQFSERAGDWYCFKCQNLNFAFRTECNRCKLSKQESDAMLQMSYSNPMPGNNDSNTQGSEPNK